MWCELLESFGTFSHEEMLQQLSERVPSTIGVELLADGAPDIEISRIGSRAAIDSLLDPLKVRSFPNGDFLDFESLLAWLLLSYSDELASHDPAKLVYVSSFYLYCYVKEPLINQAGSGAGALAVLVAAAQKLDFALVVTILRFCIWAMRQGLELDDREDAPEFHFSLAIMCLLQRCAAEISKDVDQSLRSLDYYASATRGPSALPHFRWARCWRQLLDSAAIPDGEKVLTVTSHVAEKMNGWSPLL
jgi:hypothetical protein